MTIDKDWLGETPDSHWPQKLTLSISCSAEMKSNKEMIHKNWKSLNQKSIL